MNNAKILLIYTGGTIGMNHNPQTGALEPFDFDSLLTKVPELGQFKTDIDTYQFLPPIDSSDMGPSHWSDMARLIAERYEQYDGFVVLHGTDTMSYTASALSFMLENLSKPVVLTGSQLPIDRLRTDGRENLITSIEIASARRQDGTARVPEVCVYFNGHLLRGNRTTKQSAEEFNAFESFNYPHLADAGIEIAYHEEYIHRADRRLPLRPQYELDSNVAIVSLFPGMQEAVMRHVMTTPGLRSIVLRTYGSGNAPKQPWLISTLKEATAKGIVVVNISQCMQGHVEMSRYDTGYQLKEAGVVSGHNSTVEAAVTKLMLLQARYADATQVRKMMNQCICGEISL